MLHVYSVRTGMEYLIERYAVIVISVCINADFH